MNCPVSKAHILKAHLTAQPVFARHNRTLLQRFAVFAQNRFYAGESDIACRNVSDKPPEIANRPDNLAKEAGLGKESTERNHAVDGHRCADVETSNHLDTGHNVGGRPEGGVHLG